MGKKACTGIVMIRCPGMSDSGYTTSAVLEEALLEIIKGADIVDLTKDGVRWHDEGWCLNRVQSFTRSPYDRVYCGEIDLQRMDEADQAQCELIDDWLRHVVNLNWSALNEVHELYTVEQCWLVRRHKDFWIIEFRGIRV